MSLTEDDAIEFAGAMAGERPPTNTSLIERHSEWWDENRPPEIADPITTWYQMWTRKVEDEEYDFAEFDEAYREFCDTLDDLNVDYD